MDFPSTVTADQLAALYKVERRTITNWVNSDPPCPSRKEGSRRVFDLDAVIAWREAQQSAARDEVPADFEKARARREAALAEQEELKLGQMRQELMTVADYDKAVGGTLARVDARLKALPQRIAATQWPADYAERLAKAGELVEEIRGELRAREEAA